MEKNNQEKARVVYQVIINAKTRKLSRRRAIRWELGLRVIYVSGSSSSEQR